MSKRGPSADNARRIFLKGATLAGAAALTSPVAANVPASIPSKEGAKAAVPGPRMAAAETMPPADPDPVSQSSSGGDFMVDVLKSLDIDYLAINCASSFRGLHEAVINRGGNTKPEIITCPHEEIAVHVAQGYAKMEGKPMAVACRAWSGCSMPLWRCTTPGAIVCR
jgi:acetolactate synthase I/II/III large subunit